MKKIFTFLFAAILAMGLPLASAFAQDYRRCTDPDNSYAFRNRETQRRPDITVKTTVRGSVQIGNKRVWTSRTDECLRDSRLKEYYCHPNSAYIRNSYFSCPGDRYCEDGECRPPTQLDRCGDPPGGWQNGRIYVLNQDIRWREGDDQSCLKIDHSIDYPNNFLENITLDCQGHYIVGGRERGAEVGVLFGVQLRHSKLQNCNIIGFRTGLEAKGGPYEIINNTFRDNGWGISYEGSAGDTTRFINNTACDNRGFDVTCSGAPDGTHQVSGHGNHFNNVDLRSCIQPREAVYTACGAN